ncbi:MAG TPA: adenylate/guanylate cyclase domain-containing protein [Ktedonobacterales bacterium]
MPEERKLVSILFADVTGSTALGESLELDDFRALMARYYAHARQIVEEHGGALEKFIGDALVAVFGLPQAHSNDAERALASALALRQAVGTDEVLGGRLTLRMGVNTGQVMTTITGDVHHGDFLVTGDAVNVAARLEQYASPGEILVSERTVTAAEASFLFESARTIMVKGKSQPLRVAPLIAQRPARLLGRPPLVGRARDLARLSMLRAQAFDERSPQSVAIIANAGIGKTRLLEEVLAQLDEREGWRVATARCLPFGQTLAYWPLRGLLDELLGAPFSYEAVSQVFLDGEYAPEDAQRLAVLALTALGGESDGQIERELVFNAWRLLIETLAQLSPLIVVFEDIHWASESLLDLVEYVLQPRAEAPALIIVTGRPELLDRRPTWGAERSGYTTWMLEPLSVTETRVLVGEMVEDASETTRALIAERSGGNPFFAIELARGLSSGVATPGTLPDTVQQAVQERLDALAPGERALLQAAAVAGRAFRPATLHAAMESREPADVETALENLQARDLIAPIGEGSYAFRHILIRDVAYGALSRVERIRLHLVVAHWLEDFAAGRVDEFVELIAYHYGQAAQLARQSTVPLATPVDIARAIEYLERAAARAFSAGAQIEARGYLERAIALAPESEHRRLYEALGDRSGLLSHVVTPAYRAALALWRDEAAPDHLVGARLTRKLALHIMRWHGGLTPDAAQRSEMLTWRGEALRQAKLAGDVYEQLRLRAGELFWYWWSGDEPAGDTLSLMAADWAAADKFEASGDWDAFSEALDAYGTFAFMTGDWAATYAASTRRLAAPALTLYERIDALNTVIWAQSDSGDYAGAIATARRQLAERRPGELATAFASAIFAARQDAYLSGAWEDFAALESALNEVWEEAGSHPEDPRLLRLWQGDYVFALLIAQARENRPAVERAAAMLGDLAAKDPLETRRLTFHRWIDACLRDDAAPLEACLCEVSTPDDLDLLPSYTSLIRFLSEHGRPVPERMLELIARGRMMRTVDNVKRWHQIARALADNDNDRLAAAINDAEAHGLAPHAARMRVVLAQRTGQRVHLARARSALKRLGDTLFLSKLEAVEASLR